MKKNILIVICSLLFFGTAFSQQTETKFIRFGLRGGANLGWLKPNTKDYSSEGATVRFAYGAMGEFHLVNNYLITTGFDIKSLGGKLKFPYASDTATKGLMHRTYQLKYLEIPVTLKMKTRDFGNISFFGQFGLATCLNLSAKSDDKFISNAGATIINTTDNDIKSDIGFFKESLIIGLGAEYSLGGSTSVVLGILFNNGFTDVLIGKNTKVDPIVKENATSSYVELSLGILF